MDNFSVEISEQYFFLIIILKKKKKKEVDFISLKSFSLLYKGNFDSMNYFFPFCFFFFFLFLFVLGFCFFFFFGYEL